MDDAQDLRLSLGQAVAWCAGRASEDDPASSLRTLALQPPRLESILTTEQRRRIVDDLVERRLKAMRAQGRYRFLPPQGLGGGRVLLYDPERNQFNSGPLVESYGYFDWDNLPPWDTWLGYAAETPRSRETRAASPDAPRHTPMSYLVSWVPPRMRLLAEAGAAADTDGCLIWADEAETELGRRVHAAASGGAGGSWLPSAYRRVAGRFLRPAGRATERNGDRG